MATFGSFVVLKDDGINPDTGERTLNAGVGVPITVFLTGTTTYASIRDIDDNPLSNPFNTDDLGNYEFNVDDGYYDVISQFGTDFAVKLSNRPIFDFLFPELTPPYSSVEAMQTDQNLGANLAGSDKISLSTQGYREDSYVGNADYLFMTDAQAVVEGYVPNTFNIIQCENGVAVLVIESNTIYLSRMGVISDGVEDNSGALLAMRDMMLAEPDVTWSVVGFGGTVAYKENKWLIDVKNMAFDGKGAELKNTEETAASSQESRPLHIQRLFAGDVFNNIFDLHQGFVILNSEAGAGSIFTNSVADAGKISEGEWALIYGYDQQQFSGYLPNARFFDWVLVDTVDDSTGEIKLRGGNRLRNSYSNLWADGSAGGVDIGRPRIISTVRTTQQGYNVDRTFPVNHSFTDVKFNSVSPLGISWGHSAVFLDMSNFTVKHGGAFYTALGSKVCVYDNIKFNQGEQTPETFFAIEQDKLTELCVIRNTLPARGIAGGTGVDNLVFDNMSFPKDCRVRVGAKHITFNGGELLGCRSVSQSEYMLQFSDAPVQSMRFNDTRFVMNDDQLGIVRDEAGSTEIPTGDWVALGSRQISLTGDATTGVYSSKLSIGTLLVIGDNLTDGSADYGVVTNIVASGSNNVVTVRGSKTVAFDDTQDITFYNTNAPTFNSGCSLTKRDGTIVNQPLSAATPAFLYGVEPAKTLKYSSLQMIDFSFGEIPYPCYIKEIRVNVLVPYVGADATFFVEFARLEQSSQAVRVDLLTAGYRRFNSFESVNIQLADVKTQNLFETPNLQGIRCFVRSDGGGTVPADVNESDRAPYYEVEIDVAPLIP